MALVWPLCGLCVAPVWPLCGPCSSHTRCVFSVFPYITLAPITNPFHTSPSPSGGTCIGNRSALLGPFMVGPVGPVVPVGPAGPVLPVGPVGPVGPGPPVARRARPGWVLLQQRPESGRDGLCLNSGLKSTKLLRTQTPKQESRICRHLAKQ